MAGNIYTWSTTSADNDDADSDINWLEGQGANTVNDSARAVMAANAGYLKDNNATKTTTGSANVHAVTSNIAIAALATGLRLCLKAGFTNTAAATLNVTPAGGAAFGAKAIRVFTAGAEAALEPAMIIAGGIYEFVYDTAANAAAGAWILLNPSVYYDEGTFTPGFAFGGGTTGITYGTQSGLYTRIGRSVKFTARVTLTDNGSSTGTWTVTGLPFTVNAGTNPACSLYYANVTTGLSNSHFLALCTQGSTTVTIFVNVISSGVTAAADDTFTTNTTDLIVSGEYIV